MKIGVYGGTFNPPHLGHVRAASDACEMLALDKLLVVPDTLPPHKEMPVHSPSPDDRLIMTRTAFSDCGERIEISDIEMRRAGRSYTVDTLTELKKIYPNEELVLLMGTDMFLSLETWRSFEDIMRLATIGVFMREDDDRAEIEEAKYRYESLYGAKLVTVRNNPIDISSSEIREELPNRGGGEYLNDRVYEYIIRYSLYGAKPDFDWLRVKSYGMLSPKRIRHVAGCERESVRLARRWGADEELAREAALLHDCTKRLSIEGQLALCKKYGIKIDATEKNDCKLLHSKTGAYIAKYEYGLSDEVFSAIYWHTTGKADMSLLEKVIYMADYIEPSRDFEGLSELRKIAYEDLDSAMLFGLRMSLEEIAQRGKTPHKNSKDAIAWFMAQKGRR